MRVFIASAKSPRVGGDFDHIIAHTMSCTLEGDDGYALGLEWLRFGSLIEALNEAREGAQSGCLDLDSSCS